MAGFSVDLSNNWVAFKTRLPGSVQPLADEAGADAIRNLVIYECVSTLKLIQAPPDSRALVDAHSR